MCVSPATGDDLPSLLYCAFFDLAGNLPAFLPACKGCRPQKIRAGKDLGRGNIVRSQLRTDFRFLRSTGVVKYRDAFNAKHETVFGFRVTLDDKFERIMGLTEYNKST